MNPAPNPAPDATRPVRAVIIDDEPMARRGVHLLLERDAGVEIVGEAADGVAGLELLQRVQPELAFVDVQMPAGNGFDMLRRLAPEGLPVVVFITAYDEYALQAFDVQAVDYLLKPYDDERFARALERAKEAVRRRRQDDWSEGLAELRQLLQHVREGKPGGTEAPERILVKTSGEIVLLKPDEVDWIEAEGDYVKFHVGGHAHMMRETMARLEARLNPKHFVRIHRSTIVNIERIRKLSPSFAGDYVVILQDGTRLRLSRGFHERLASLLHQAL
ncbi:LytTR family DNA-binding domain-containing protein [Opitutus sp. ER46]|uniref:LytR/AlgR family response regulator transcription factor n=1 Tax=Opitutus sp. ER46 TaxID=2161864 RepID=UPI000D31D0FE|nr:LytTR family DNA-binding domain-containing protein [Opitutus sp. ER46]PTY00072.1 DNA-binding response regulator [Opitutus sp. ER46]